MKEDKERLNKELDHSAAHRNLGAEQHERVKTAAERAEDIAYTINHSLYCTLTDFINPPVNAATDNWLRWLIPGCGHDHSQDGGHHDGHHHMPAGAMPAAAPVPHHHHSPGGHVHGHVHGPQCNHGHDLVPLTASCGHTHHGPPSRTPHAPLPKPSAAHVCGHGHMHIPANLSRWEKVKLATRHAFSKERFVQYAKGEFIGDFAAVPITIGMQRMFPGAMVAIRKMTEPVMRPIFRWGVERDSKSWAYKRGVDTDSAEYKQHVQDVYEHEMSHFPQAVVWTAAALGLNVGYQMHADKSDIPFWTKAALKSGSVLSGVMVTAGVVVAARALAPHKVREFDKWTSSNVILPSTKAVSKVFGVDEDAVDRMLEKEARLKDGDWAERVSQPASGANRQV